VGPIRFAMPLGGRSSGGGWHPRKYWPPGTSDLSARPSHRPITSAGGVGGSRRPRVLHDGASVGVPRAGRFGAKFPFSKRLRLGKPAKREPGDREQSGVLVVSALARFVRQSPAATTSCIGRGRRHVDARREAAAGGAEEKQAPAPPHGVGSQFKLDPQHARSQSPSCAGPSARTRIANAVAQEPRVYLFSGEDAQALVDANPPATPPAG
jgi:hypothetical protein